MGQKQDRHLHDQQEDQQHDWPGYYKCDELVPPLCDDTLTVTTGTVETLPGLMVTYWKYTPADQDRSKFPIVVINGGPGLPHNFMKPLRNFACDGREVVMYDQAGTGWSQLSKHQEKKDAYPELFDIQYYAETELPALLDELGWKRYHVLASSWGTQIAFQYAVTMEGRGHGGIESLILNAPIADNHKFIEYQWDQVDGSVGNMPTYIQKRLQYFNNTKDFDNEEFIYLQDMVMANFNARLGVLVDCWTETEYAGISTLDLGRMMGDTDLFFPDPSATMRGWTVLPHLHKIKHIPVQLNYGQYDLVRPHLVADTARELAAGMVECHRYTRAGHSILLDAPEEVYPQIQDFLLRVEDFTMPFYPNGTCPYVGADGLVKSEEQQYECLTWPKPRHYKGKTIDAVWLLGFLVSMVATFKLGLWAGTRQHRKDSGYENL